MTDAELWKLHRQGWSVVALAVRSGLGVAGVTSALERHNRHLSIGMLDRATRVEADLPPSQRGLQDLMANNWQRWQGYLRHLRTLDRWSKLAFWADAHLPYQSNEAIELAATITHDFKPDIVTAFNDVFDFKRLGKWENADDVYDRLWDSDLQNALDAHAVYSRIQRDAAPHAALIAVVGNHDERLAEHLTAKSADTSGFTLRHFYEEISHQGVLYMGPTPEGDAEGLTLSPGLKIWHGRYASKSLYTVVKNSLEALEDNGVFYATISGHVHRISSFVVYGVHGLTSGCLCKLQPHWTTRPMHWQAGIVLGAFDPNGREVSLYNITFHRVNNNLIAHYGDKEYRVRLLTK